MIKSPTNNDPFGSMDASDNTPVPGSRPVEFAIEKPEATAAIPQLSPQFSKSKVKPTAAIPAQSEGTYTGSDNEDPHVTDMDIPHG